MAQLRAKSRGFSDVLYLDSITKKNLEEVSSCNIFIAKVFFESFYFFPFNCKDRLVCIFQICCNTRNMMIEEKQQNKMHTKLKLVFVSLHENNT